MKNFYVLIAAALLSLNATTIAEQPKGSINNQTTLQKTSSNNRPRTLTPDSIECSYELDILYFYTDIEITYADVDIINCDNLECKTYQLLYTDNSLQIQLESGCYLITFNCNLGVYEGYLTIF